MRRQGAIKRQKLMKLTNGTDSNKGPIEVSTSNNTMHETSEATWNAIESR